MQQDSDTDTDSEQPAAAPTGQEPLYSYEQCRQILDALHQAQLDGIGKSQITVQGVSVGWSTPTQLGNAMSRWGFLLQQAINPRRTIRVV